MHVKAIRIKSDSKYYTLVYRGKPFVRISKDSLPEFFADLKKDNEVALGLVEKVKKKRRVIPSKTVDAKRNTKALQLAKKYAAEFRRWSKSKLHKPIGPNHKDFKHLLAAVDIINNHGVKNKVFLKAQIEGLKFANEGKGIFPKINQLSTSNAEMRLVEYLKKDEEADIRVELTESEKATPLQDNKLYTERYEKVRQGIATYKEGLYVKNCIIARRGRVPKNILKDIEALKKK